MYNLTPNRYLTQFWSILDQNFQVEFDMGSFGFGCPDLKYNIQ